MLTADEYGFYLCHEGTSRGGVYQPCDLHAVAFRRDPESMEPYPVCSAHARGMMIPLGDVPRLIRQLSS